MLFGNTKQLGLLPFADKRIPLWIEAALEMSAKPEGKYDVTEDGVFLVLMKACTEDASVRKPEIHKQYIDIQIVLEGEEKIGYANTLGQETVALKTLENDVMFLDEVENEQFVYLGSGDFALFYPDQIHRPLCSVTQDSEVKKAILKIPAALFS